MRKSQFHPSKNNLKPSRKNLNLPEEFLPHPPPRENCLTITETTSNNRTKSQPLPKQSQPLPKKSQPPKISQPHETFSKENFSIPLEKTLTPKILSTIFPSLFKKNLNPPSPLNTPLHVHNDMYCRPMLVYCYSLQLSSSVELYFNRYNV